jgi:hypothetical protein
MNNERNEKSVIISHWVFVLSIILITLTIYWYEQFSKLK